LELSIKIYTSSVKETCERASLLHDHGEKCKTTQRQCIPQQKGKQSSTLTEKNMLINSNIVKQ
jgi:HD superfamily phosphohydrolase YqeK